jgi:hypothetical protein
MGSIDHTLLPHMLQRSVQLQAAPLWRGATYKHVDTRHLDLTQRLCINSHLIFTHFALQ